MHAFDEQWQIYKPAIRSESGVVAAQHWQAAEAGAQILATGGHAVDAAIATALALNAVEPWMSGLGGNGYMLIWSANEHCAYALNFQGQVATALDLADYPIDPLAPLTLMNYPGVVDKHNLRGYGSMAIPGAVAGLAAAHQRFGQLGWDRLVQPAIDLAERGLPVDWFATLNIALQWHALRHDPVAAQIYFDAGCPPQPDQYRALGELPTTLRWLAEHGPNDFYRGRLAERIAADLQAGGSAISYDDLAQYRAEWVEPLHGIHRGTQVFGADASSGARRLLDMLAIVERELQPMTQITADTYRAYAHGLDMAFAAHQRRIGQTGEHGCTTHLSVADAEGNLVALTNTLLDRFGSQTVLPQTGILLNNALGYFDPRPGYPTSLAPGKRINSSNMCPTLAIGDRVHFALGASGAQHIVPAVAQLTALLLDYGLSLEQAMHTPRIEATHNGKLQMDPRISPAMSAELAEEFHLERAALKVFPKLYACPSAVLIDRRTGLYHAATDPSSPVAGSAAAALC